MWRRLKRGNGTVVAREIPVLKVGGSIPSCLSLFLSGSTLATRSTFFLHLGAFMNALSGPAAARQAHAAILEGLCAAGGVSQAIHARPRLFY